MKHILIVGAKSDIARALARNYAARGCTLTLASRVPAEIEADIKDLSIRGATEVHNLSLDVSDPQATETFLQSLNFLPDVVICAVGYLGDQKATEQSPDEMRRVVESNYLGPARLLEQFAAKMKKSGTGTIVGISSVAGDRGRASNYWYGSAKAGFTAFLSGLRQRLYGSGVIVLTVKPGFVNTAMTKDLSLPKALTASPERVARDVIRATERKQLVLYTPWFWWGIMFLIKKIPEFLYVRIKF